VIRAILLLFGTLALLALGWAAGYGLFLLSLGRPLEARKTDAIVVLTGGPGRIGRGLDALRAGDAERMLVSGVDPAVKPHELAAQFKRDTRLFDCCVELGHEAVDTRSNADETAQWVRKHRYKSVRLVTTDWHMPRARMELSHALGGDVEVIGDAVESSPEGPGSRVLLREYNKFLVRRLVLWAGAR
jgi:uncharacterized SAM-binding protein YcdF (DUF218 family)